MEGAVGAGAGAGPRGMARQCYLGKCELDISTYMCVCVRLCNLWFWGRAALSSRTVKLAQVIIMMSVWHIVVVEMQLLLTPNQLIANASVCVCVWVPLLHITCNTKQGVANRQSPKAIKYL